MSPDLTVHREHTLNPLPSAFQVAELPLHLAHSIFKKTSNEWTQQTGLSHLNICLIVAGISDLIINRKTTSLAIRTIKTQPGTSALALLPTGVNMYYIFEHVKTLHSDVKQCRTADRVSLTKVAQLAIPMLAIYMTGLHLFSYISSLIAISIVADVIIGGMECLYHRFHGATPENLNTLFYKKIVIAPLHQALFLAKIFLYPVEILYATSPDMFKAIYTPVLKEVLQKIISREKGILTHLLNQVREHCSTNSSWFYQYEVGRRTITNIEQEGINAFRENTPPNSDAESGGWLSSKDYTILTHLSPPKNTNWAASFTKNKTILARHTNVPVRLIPFKNTVETTDTSSPNVLLGNPTNKRAAKRAYRRISLQIHPDKNNNNPTSTLLTKILANAYEEITHNFESGEEETSNKSNRYALNFLSKFIDLRWF